MVDDDFTSVKAARRRANAGLGPDHGDRGISSQGAGCDLAGIRIDAAGQVDGDHPGAKLAPSLDLG